TLNLARVGRKDNFFDLGGHSILAVKLFSSVESRFGKRLPLATLYEYPTVEKLSLLLEDAYEVSWDPMVTIQSNGTKQPLFFMHSEGGNVLEYYHLSRELGLDQPFYALQAYGLDSGIAKYKTIEEMANRYINDIRKVQRNGPYLLGGYCLGGLIAYEVAQQIMKDGEEVAFLGLVSVVEPNHWKEKVEDLNPFERSLFSVQERVGLELDNLRVLPLREKMVYSWDRIHTGTTIIQTKLEGFAGNLLTKFNKEINNHSNAYKLRMIKESNIEAFYSYNPLELKNGATLFRANKYSRLVALGDENGWGKLVNNKLKVINIDAYHKNILKYPNVKQLAENIKLCLADT
ncbi:thioesterase domain-containing protein, partial [Thermodesulfobacteriota bacterium]